MGKLSPCLYAGGKGPRNEKDDNSGEKEDVAGWCLRIRRTGWDLVHKSGADLS